MKSRLSLRSFILLAMLFGLIEFVSIMYVTEHRRFDQAQKSYAEGLLDGQIMLLNREAVTDSIACAWKRQTK